MRGMKNVQKVMMFLDGQNQGENMVEDFWINKNVKVAVIVVHVCNECPYMEMDQITPYCDAPRRTAKKLHPITAEVGPIPDWCPLPNRDKGE